MTSRLNVLIESPGFGKQVNRLPQELQLIAKVALIEILSKEGLALASSNWLRYVGDSVWEFRIGRSIKAVYSKAGIEDKPPASRSKVLLRIFCHFEENKVILLGCYDKQKYSDGRRQANAIRTAKEELLTFRKMQ